ncbi:MAG: DUF1028 domain-containing protein [Actinomycetota bacterium]
MTLRLRSTSTRRLPRAALILLVCLIGLLWAGPAGATWSIAAVDPATGRVGAAMASCVPSGLLGEPDQVLVPVVLVPGTGAAVTQGNIDPDAPIGLRQLLGDGFGPQDAIDAILELDEQPTARQYGVALLPTVERTGAGGPTAGYTGTDVEAASWDWTTETAAAQGNLLADARAVDETLAAFDAAMAAGASLEEALVAGLDAGAALGGDRRCEPGQTALFAHVAVADPDDDPFRPSVLLTVTVDEGDGQNPVSLLVDALDDGERGWVDAGLEDPVGIARVAVLAVGALLAVAAFLTIRKGLGSPAARR